MSRTSYRAFISTKLLHSNGIERERERDTLEREREREIVLQSRETIVIVHKERFGLLSNGQHTHATATTDGNTRLDRSAWMMGTRRVFVCVCIGFLYLS